ncbi:MAG TPA: hypothetical protein HPP57_07640 [Deltaproteobacteria bacterium]|jgi:hypothetical protein|nr:hypothetical protein [Deltaproteobacteria bacterium]
MAQLQQSPFLRPEALKKFEEVTGKYAVAVDQLRALFDQVSEHMVGPAVELETQKSGEPIVTLHEPGEIVEMSDGRKYEVQDNGQWKRIN